MLPDAAWYTSDVRSTLAHGGRLAFECTLHLVVAPQNSDPVRRIVRSTKSGGCAMVNLKGFIKQKTAPVWVSWVDTSTPASPSLCSCHALGLIWGDPCSLEREIFGRETRRWRGRSLVGASSQVGSFIVICIQERGSYKISNAPF